MLARIAECENTQSRDERKRDCNLNLRLYHAPSFATIALCDQSTTRAAWEVIGKDGKAVIYSHWVGVIEHIAKGLGDTARDIAISIALASIIGMCLMESGAADKVVRRFLKIFGE